MKLPPLMVYDEAPAGLNVALPPEHIELLDAVSETDGVVFTDTVTTAELVQLPSVEVDVALTV